jgi:hypothetical protein
MSKACPAGFTGEWIVRVKGLAGQQEADEAWDRIIAAVKSVLPDAEIVFDGSRWKGGDF